MGGSKEGTQKDRKGTACGIKTGVRTGKQGLKSCGRTMESEDHRTERTVEWDYGNRDVPYRTEAK